MRLQTVFEPSEGGADTLEEANAACHISASTRNSRLARRGPIEIAPVAARGQGLVSRGSVAKDQRPDFQPTWRHRDFERLPFDCLLLADAIGKFDRLAARAQGHFISQGRRLQHDGVCAEAETRL